MLMNDPTLIDETAEAIAKIQSLGWTFAFDIASKKYQACIKKPDGSLEVEHEFLDWEQIIAFAEVCKMTLHQRFLRLQERLVTEDGYRLVQRKVAKRFCRRYTARLVDRNDGYTRRMPDTMLILEFDHPDIGAGEQLIAFVTEV